MLKPRYIRRASFVLIDKSRKWNAGGCHSYTLYNQGNVNITINNVVVLRPGQYLAGPTESFEVTDHSDIDVQFDMVNNPTVVQPDTGPAPQSLAYFPGDAVPTRDTRLIIIQSFLSVNDKV